MPRHHALGSRARRGILALFLALAAIATIQRGVLTHTHATFPVFRQSFVHLRAGQDLYAAYPGEQGTEDRDRFKYSPSAAMFFAPFAMLPFVAGLLLWTVLNALALFFAVDRLIPGRDGTAALLIVFPALIAAVQSTSSNALIAALMVTSFVALEAERLVRSSTAIAAGALMKLYPAAAVPFVLLHPRPWRAAAKLALVVAVLLALPLLVTGPGQLLAQYKSWAAILTADEGDLTFARSIMVVVRNWTGLSTPNWMFQAAATLILVAPIAFRRSQWHDPAFRKSMLASLLIYVVIFNHQAENSSYVIASIGLAVWYLNSERTLLRTVLLVLCLVGLEAIPYTLVWFWLQFDLLDGGRLGAWIAARIPESAAIDPQDFSEA
jgi:Glycosyltransferase family 87